MLVEKGSITDFLPQRPPMVMVDGLLSSDEKQTISLFMPGIDNLLCLDGYFTEPGLIENMAQTAALRAGWESAKKREEVATGFIGAVKNFRLHRLPLADEQLTTTITVTQMVWQMTRVQATVHAGGQIAAEAELSIFTLTEQQE